MEAANPIPVRTNAIVSIIVYSYGDVRIKSSIRLLRIKSKFVSLYLIIDVLCSFSE